MALPPFQTALDAHGATVHRFLRARVGAVDADDCWQETFVSALRAYPSLRPDSDVRAWLLTIAHRKAVDHVRASARRPLPSPAVEPAAVVDAAPGRDPVWDRVAALPDKQRAAVALRYVCDLAHAEIAAAMGTSESAARRNLHEALTTLRKELAP